MNRFAVPLLAFVLAFGSLSCTRQQKEQHMIQKSPYGRLPDGREVEQYTMTNSSGASVSVITYGATVTSLRVPDRSGALADVVLGYDSLQGYIDGSSYFGCIVGRYGNRIGKGRFMLGGKTVQVTVNDGKNHLHGGAHGFHRVLWEVTAIHDSSQPSITLTHVSPDGDEGYPGTVRVQVTYTWTADNALRLEYSGTTDKLTILNPTHHSYFNLSGSFENTILDHRLMIAADAMTPVDKELITTGTLVDVANTPMDFRMPAAIGARIDAPTDQLVYGKGYDHNWVLRGYDRTVHKVAELYEPSSGRSMSVLTDQPGLQFYSGNFLDGTSKGKGVAYQHRTGLCLEAQAFPDSPNKPSFPSVVLKPGDVYRQTTVYQFSTK